MAAITYNGTLIMDIETDNGNEFVAHLQAAAFRRLSAGEGFYLTGVTSDGATPDGAARSHVVSHWIHPGIPLQFRYTVIETITLDDAKVDEFLGYMEGPLGMLVHPECDAGDLMLPFQT